MKTTQKVTRVQLKVNQNDESALIGIVTAEPDYKLSLSLNKNLKIFLKSTKPVAISSETGEDLIFSRFSDSSGSHGIVYDLISNRTGKNFLLKKLKNVDFILQIYNPENQVETDEVISSLRNTDHITAVFVLDRESLKDKNLQFITR